MMTSQSERPRAPALASATDDRTLFHQTDHVFAGNLHGLPEKESAVVRIFLSSTFTDMQCERNWLMKNAVPHLRRFCQERGLDFQIVDMRWGVRDDAADDHRTTELCLREIRNCQRVSRGPNFVAFLGDKYGYRPLPSKIEGAHFKMLKKAAMRLGYDTGLLLSWYLCDNNEEPAMYVLQPISSKLPGFIDASQAQARKQAQAEWAMVCERLAWLLRKCADHLYKQGKLTQDERHFYFKSVTETEVEQGMLSARDIKDKVACFQRTLVDLDTTDPMAWRYTDLTEENSVDPQVEELRERLRLVKIPEALAPDQIYRYNVTWQPGGINNTAYHDHQSYVEGFGQDFTKTVEHMIEEADLKANSVKGRSPLFEEVLHHLHFCKSKCDTFCGRDNLLRDINTKLNKIYGKNENNDGANIDAVTNPKNDIDAEEREKTTKVTAELEQLAATMKEKVGLTFTWGDSMDDMESDPQFNLRDRLTALPAIAEHTKPIIIYGESGCGKTALMAKVAQMSKQWFPAQQSIKQTTQQDPGNHSFSNHTAQKELDNQRLSAQSSTKQNIQQESGNHSWFPDSCFMVRFLGTSTMSTTIRETLVSLCQQLWHVYKVPRPAGIDLSADFQFLVKYFAALLWNIDTTTRPLVIILDSVDQLTPADHAHYFKWIPHKLPPTVHLLISMITNRHDCLANIRQIFVANDHYVEITKMEKDTALAMITSLCIKSNRHVSAKQRNLLMDKFAECGQPLYLKLLTDMAMSWKSYTRVSPAALGKTVKEAINHLFNNLEKKHGEVLIKKAFAYLCAAREGLTDAEIEDLLSLDDEVLQDTYIYHLPPDPDIIRLPPLLWKRVEYDIAEYVVERQSGSTKVITWYHRQFMEAATERYLKDDIRVDVHKAMAEYFQGAWSVMFKPLELRKGKKGIFPRAMRNVPPQPLKFSDTRYNSRKLSELPYHLAGSQQFHTLMVDHLLEPEWLYAKCKVASLTALMEDIKVAETGCANLLILDRQELHKREGQSGMHNRRRIEDAANKLQKDTQVLAAIKQLARMILLASDSIRKNPVNLPLQILCQCGPQLQEGTMIDQLVTRCRHWCEEAGTPLLLPLRECTLKPEGGLLYTIEVDMVLTGEDFFERPPFKGVYLREDIDQLFVIRKRNARADQLAVFDIHDFGSCIQDEDLSWHIYSIQFVAKNRYLLLETDKDTWHLYRSTTSSPVKLPHPAMTMAVSDSGKYIAFTSDRSLDVCSLADNEVKPYFTRQDHELIIDTTHISPDDAYLITTETEASKDPFFKFFSLAETCTLSVYDLKTKEILYKNNIDLKVTPRSPITKHNILICGKRGYQYHGTVVVYDLKKGSVLHEVRLGQYELDYILLHSSQLYVLIGIQDTGVTNGDTAKHASLVSIKTGRVCGKCSGDEGPNSSITFFGTDCLYYALCHWNENKVTIYFAGYTMSPLEQAVPVHSFQGHNMPVVQILVTSNMDIMYTASKDNTIKVWDLKPVLEGFRADIKKVEKLMPKDSDLDDVVAQLKSPEIEVKNVTTRVALSRLADRVYVGTDTSQLRMYDTQSGALKLTSDLGIGSIEHMMLSKSGQYLIVGGKTIHIEDFQSMATRALMPRGPPSCMAESNNILVAGSAGMSANGRVWNITTGEVLKDFELLYSFYSVAISSLGNMVVSTMFDIPVVVHLTDEEEEPGFNMDNADTQMASGICCAISPDDKIAACGSTDGAVRVIRMTGEYLYRLQQRSSAIALAFKPDGRSLVSSGYRSIYVWNMKDGSLKYKLTRHRDFVNHLMFDETGRYLVTSSHDKQLVLWDFRRAVSIATCQTHCQASSIDIGPKAETIVYIPTGMADVGIFKPNESLTCQMQGHYKSVAVTPQTQALALAFSGQTMGKTSRACSIM